jgi:hypothetical protein
LALARGTPKKNDGPWGGWLVPRRPKKYQGWSKQIARFFYRVFELPSPRNAQKRDKKNREKKWVLDFLSIFLQKLFDTSFFCKTFFVVFLDSHRQVAPENAIKQKKSRKN